MSAPHACFLDSPLRSPRSAWLAFAMLTGAVRLCAGLSESIAISATAAPDYVRPVDAQGAPRPETYVFAEGNFMGGGTSDSSEARIKFADVTRSLAQNLAKQNYFPTKDVPSADIIIMVHWGTTLIYEDPQKEFVAEKMNAALAGYQAGVAENGMADPGVLNSALDSQATAQQGADAAIARNARLLGYRRALDKERRKTMPGPAELAMSMELNEERYFVVLLAYDYQYMRREHRPRLLWITRLSVRSPGNNFVEALPTLTLAGGDVFGRQIAGLARVKAQVRRGQVTLGELEVLGTEENLRPARSAK